MLSRGLGAAMEGGLQICTQLYVLQAQAVRENGEVLDLRGWVWDTPFTEGSRARPGSGMDVSAKHQALGPSSKLVPWTTVTTRKSWSEASYLHRASACSERLCVIVQQGKKGQLKGQRKRLGAALLLSIKCIASGTRRAVPADGVWDVLDLKRNQLAFSLWS